MKVRAGFVSNSSSSSFMIYGGAVTINGNEEELYKKLCKGKTKREIAEMNDVIEYEDGEFGDNYEMREYLEDLVPEGHSLYYRSYDDEDACIGIEPNLQRDDQTHGDWKKQIREDLTKAFGDCIGDFGWYEDCSYDG